MPPCELGRVQGNGGRTPYSLCLPWLPGLPVATASSLSITAERTPLLLAEMLWSLQSSFLLLSPPAAQSLFCVARGWLNRAGGAGGILQEDGGYCDAPHPQSPSRSLDHTARNGKHFKASVPSPDLLTAQKVHFGSSKGSLSPLGRLCSSSPPLA